MHFLELERELTDIWCTEYVADVGVSVSFLEFISKKSFGEPLLPDRQKRYC